MKASKTHETNDRDKRERSGAEGGESDAAKRPPPAPARDDDSPLGDTDQHSETDA